MEKNVRPARVNPDINHVLWLTLMCQRRLTDHNKGPTPVGDVDNEGGCAWVWAAGMRKISVPLTFAMNVKPL